MGSLVEELSVWVGSLRRELSLRICIGCDAPDAISPAAWRRLHGSTVLKEDPEGFRCPQHLPRPMIRALIAGRSRVHSEALAAALSQGRHVQVLATASHPQEVLALLGEVMPDIVLVDFATSEAVKIVADIRRRTPSVKVVAITLGESEAEVIQLAEAGVAGYLLPDGSLDDLVIELATVKNHVHNILKKLHVHRRIDASAWYRRGGFHLKLEPQKYSSGRVEAKAPPRESR